MRHVWSWHAKWNTTMPPCRQSRLTAHWLYDISRFRYVRSLDSPMPWLVSSGAGARVMAGCSKGARWPLESDWMSWAHQCIGRRNPQTSCPVAAQTCVQICALVMPDKTNEQSCERVSVGQFGDLKREGGA